MSANTFQGEGSSSFPSSANSLIFQPFLYIERDQLPTTLLPLLTCFIVVGRELVQHLTIHGQDALLEDAGVRESALSLLSLKGLQLLPQAFWQVGLHIVSCSLAEGGGSGEGRGGTTQRGSDSGRWISEGKVRS